MDEEFEESEVIFVEVEVWDKQDDCYDLEKRQHNTNTSTRKRKKKKRSSVPISIPENRSNLFAYEGSTTVEYDLFEDDYGSEERMIAAHVMWSRRRAENVAYSICTERGETFKIRDFIFKITGFLEF